MVQVIYKYPLPPLERLTVDGKLVLDLPKGARIFSALVDNYNDMVVYAIVDPQEPTEQVLITVRGTGHLVMDSDGEFLCTLKVGAFVWHLFYKHLEEEA